MNPLKRNPIMQVLKCEMCPNTVTNFVTGLCGRCSSIWARQHAQPTYSPYQAMVATVRMAQNPEDFKNMDPTFKEVIENARKMRAHKVQLFQKIRNQFLGSVLMEPVQQQPTSLVVEDDYWNVPEIMDMDFISFQNQIDLLKDVNAEPNNNKPAETEVKYKK